MGGVFCKNAPRARKRIAKAICVRSSFEECKRC